MKRLAFAVTAMSIAGGSALAADLPPPMAPPPRAPAMYVPVAPVYNWTGFYICATIPRCERIEKSRGCIPWLANVTLWPFSEVL
jgi:hypothetical protein